MCVLLGQTLVDEGPHSASAITGRPSRRGRDELPVPEFTQDPARNLLRKLASLDWIAVPKLVVAVHAFGVALVVDPTLVGVSCARVGVLGAPPLDRGFQELLHGLQRQVVVVWAERRVGRKPTRGPLAARPRLCFSFFLQTSAIGGLVAHSRIARHAEAALAGERPVRTPTRLDMRVEPTGIVVFGVCDVQIGRRVAKVLSPITAVWTTPGGNQINVCKSCLDDQLRSGAWAIEGARAAGVR